MNTIRTSRVEEGRQLFHVLYNDDSELFLCTIWQLTRLAKSVYGLGPFCLIYQIMSGGTTSARVEEVTEFIQLCQFQQIDNIL